MKAFKVAGLCCMIVAVAGLLIGCGIPREKYEAALNEKIVLEEKVAASMKAKDALKNEYDALLNEKMDQATKLETSINEKAALKSEYDKLLDEKISLKAAYDKLLAESRAIQESVTKQ
jgi:predicted nuclease with TOPRIM domain